MPQEVSCWLIAQNSCQFSSLFGYQGSKQEPEVYIFTLEKREKKKELDTTSCEAASGLSWSASILHQFCHSTKPLLDCQRISSLQNLSGTRRIEHDQFLVTKVFHADVRISSYRPAGDGLNGSLSCLGIWTEMNINKFQLICCDQGTVRSKTPSRKPWPSWCRFLDGWSLLPAGNHHDARQPKNPIQISRFQALSLGFLLNAPRDKGTERRFWRQFQLPCGVISYNMLQLTNHSAGVAWRGTGLQHLRRRRGIFGSHGLHVKIHKSRH